MQFQRRHRQPVQVSMTPMIDVVFLLLIFFMVTTTFNRETELQIQLPEAEGKERAEEKSLEIVIDSQGRYRVNKNPVADQKLETLKKAMRAAAGQSKNLPLIISADEKTPHQFVIRALDAAGQLGFVHISFATQEPAETQ
jgi:biopolymer transport protein ExbD